MSTGKAITVAAQTKLTNYSFDESDTAATAAHPLTLNVVPGRRTHSFVSLRRNLLFGVAALVMFAGGVTALVAQTVIAGAVVSAGVLVVESGPKAVQHLTGGIVRKLLVKQDQFVAAGQPLIELDTTVAEAQLDSAKTSLLQQRARLDRLTAERDGLDTIKFSDMSAELSADPRFASIIDSEQRQFALRLEQRNGQRAQIRERIDQVNEELKGQETQLAATREQIGLTEKELEGLRQLFIKKLVGQQRLNELERTISELRGSEGALMSAIASNRGKIAEFELMVMQVDQTLRSEITDQIAAAQESISVMTEKKVVAEMMLAQSIIYAPQEGVVHQLAIHTIGGVVRPADTLMVIVPDNDRLIGQVRLRPSDIDQLYPGQAATVTFSAFDRGTTPSINGTLVSVSPDLQVDQRSGVQFYEGRISIKDDQVARLGEVKLVPGMPIEAFVQTGDRTMVSYFMKPLTDQLNRAFR